MRTLTYVIAGITAIVCITGCSSRNMELRIRQSQELIRQSQHETARIELEKLALSHPRDPQIQFLLGQANLALGNYSEAVTAFENAERNGITQTAEFHLRKGIALYSAGTIGKAETSFDASVRIQPSGEAYRYLGLIRSQHADYIGAVQAFERASGLDNDITALTAYGTSLYYSGRIADALDMLVQALNRDRDNEYLIFHTANAYLLNERTREAIDLYGRLSESSRYYPDALYNQSEAYQRLGDFENAVIHFEAYLELMPDDNAAMFNLATALIGSGEYVIAIERLTALLDDEAYRIRVEYNLGVANYYLGRTEDAIRYYALAVRHDPDNIRYRYAFAIALSDYGDISSASEQIDEILARNPDNADALAWLNRHTAIR